MQIRGQYKINHIPNIRHRVTGSFLFKVTMASPRPTWDLPPIQPWINGHRICAWPSVRTCSVALTEWFWGWQRDARCIQMYCVICFFVVGEGGCWLGFWLTLQLAVCCISRSCWVIVGGLMLVDGDGDFSGCTGFLDGHGSSVVWSFTVTFRCSQWLYRAFKIFKSFFAHWIKDFPALVEALNRIPSWLQTPLGCKKGSRRLLRSRSKASAVTDIGSDGFEWRNIQSKMCLVHLLSPYTFVDSRMSCSIKFVLPWSKKFAKVNPICFRNDPIFHWLLLEWPVKSLLCQKHAFGTKQLANCRYPYVNVANDVEILDAS